MRCKHFTIYLILYSLCIFANTSSYSTVFFKTITAKDTHTIDRTLSNQHELALFNQTSEERSIEYPTQVIRLSRLIENEELTCDEVNKKIDSIFVDKIPKDKFSYATYISCTFDPETQNAIHFQIYSYFDPLNDEAVTYLEHYLHEYNGSNLLGSPFTIEAAKALIVSLNLSAGVKKNPRVPPFIQYREDRSDFYFKNNYELQIKLLNDVKERFFSDNPDKILPFLDKWLFDRAGMLYRKILRDSNYILLQPERIFLMDNGEPIFVSPIKFYYAHDCSTYDHKQCLQQGLD